MTIVNKSEVEVEELVAEPKIKIASAVEIQEEKQTIVHCHITDYSEDLLIRIWPTTYLRDVASGHQSKLVTAFNISFHPVWTSVKKNHVFTLIFEGLPKSCNSFDLIENIPQSGGFYAPGIQRNKTDVYTINV